MGFITADPSYDRQQTIMPPTMNYERNGFPVTERRASFVEAAQMRWTRVIIALLLASFGTAIFIVLVPFAFLLGWVVFPVAAVAAVMVALFSGTELREAECPACHLITRVGMAGQVGLCRKCFSRHVYHEDGYIRGLA